MKVYIIPLIIFTILISCGQSETNRNNTHIGENKNDSITHFEDTQINSIDKTDTITKGFEEGFLFIDIGSIYYKEKELAILDSKQDTIIFFKNTKVYIDGFKYDIINEEHLYKNKIEVKSYDAEYGLFILKCVNSAQSDSYEVTINGRKGFINKANFGDLLKFKTPQQFVLEGYPNPTRENPLRIEPNDSSKVVDNFTDYSYISIEIKGDWLKIKDDKDCFIGEYPSEKDIIGWVRWRKNGEIIIDIRHLC